MPHEQTHVQTHEQAREQTHEHGRRERSLPPQWRMGLAGVAAIGVTFGFARYGYGLFLPEFRREFGLSVSLMGLIGSATYLGYVAALVMVGALVSRVGPRPLVVLGGLSATTGMGLVAFARTPVTLTAGLILAGTSSGWAWAPYSDAVDRMVPPGRRERVMGVIASGTAFAVVVAGPLALVAHGARWRYAWLAFAAAALVTTLYNARVLPGGAHRSVAAGARGVRLEARWFARRPAVPLFLTALSYGLVGAVYWAFAVEVISSEAGRNAPTAPLFWTLMGLTGTAGALTGSAIARYGLRRVHALIFAGIAAAVALLGAAPGTLAAVTLSAVLYGPCFMAGSGLLAVWSYRVFPDQPSTGFSVTVLCLGVGTVTGPAVLGLFSDAYGLRAAFLATAAAAALTLLIRPSAPGRTVSRSRARTRGPVGGGDASPSVRSRRR
ncbi:MFS transporter [Streptomyces sporangiiformans]|uniref:MFS transporter n=1 Tax=Streptomyces sporangiiformans TaxID=2315329 RepID=A0A505D746_9ACTN|nr:MFS transporter [Streptomyces sporangiiformans]TPQ20343.1 MFS transporter [Streptomyces sporangiiformans]